MRKDTRTAKELVRALCAKAVSADRRVQEDGPILGWAGFHMDLDDAEDLIARLRLKVRGLDVPLNLDATSPTGGTDPKGGTT